MLRSFDTSFKAFLWKYKGLLFWEKVQRRETQDVLYAEYRGGREIGLGAEYEDGDEDGVVIPLSLDYSFLCLQHPIA